MRNQRLAHDRERWRVVGSNAISAPTTTPGLRHMIGEREREREIVRERETVDVCELVIERV